jgi:hypothetical protein
MAREKRNPLPLGRYWVDIRKEYVPDFTELLRIVGRGIVVMQNREREDPFSTAGGNTGYLFEVRDPLIPWDSTKFGYPNIATGMTDLDQTGQVPAAEPLFGSSSSDWTTPLLILAAVYLLGSMG